MGSICLLCGDRGFAKAFVDCAHCLDASVHIYCLGLDVEETCDEDFRWVCEECETEAHTVSSDIERFSKDGKNDNDSSAVQTEERVYEDGVEQSYEGILMQFVRKEYAKCNWTKKRSVKRSTVKRYKHRLCNAPSKRSYDKHVKTVMEECTRSKDDSTLSTKMKEKEGPTLEGRSAEMAVENDFRENSGISSAVPVVMPIWRGSFNIRNENRDIIDGIIAHMSSKARGNVYDEASQFQVVLDLEMLPVSDVWPKSFEKSEPSCADIALYFFPSEISERIFDGLVEEMMHKELALKAVVQNGELLIFTSKELPILYWRFQGKYYLWGVFRGSKQSNESNPHSCTEKLDENIPIATTPTELLSDGTKTGKKLDYGWLHANQLDALRIKAECIYCGFISSYGGISRLKAHLAGVNPRIRGLPPGCDKVSPEVKKIMSDWFSEWVKISKVRWNKKIGVAEMGRRGDVAVGPTDQSDLAARKRKAKRSTALFSPDIEAGDNPYKRGRPTTLDQITNTSVKDRLKKSIRGMNANLLKMQFKIQSLERQLASMP
ncbi:hypothetical protein ACP275_03G094300 [Erythranthe tilingii]